MSTGNPFGLSEISHYGTMRCVGGKAGGFINKKFFHPSSFKNQEKLWKAMNADSKLKRAEQELESRREEERKVEELKRQAYQRGQSHNVDTSMFTIFAESGSRRMREQQLAHSEFKRRQNVVRGIQPHDAVNGHINPKRGCADSTKVAEQILATSIYAENVHRNGHTTVWGSWYSADQDRWGFACCRIMDQHLSCPYATDDSRSSVRTKASRGTRGRNARKRKNCTSEDLAEGIEIDGRKCGADCGIDAAIAFPSCTVIGTPEL